MVTLFNIRFPARTILLVVSESLLAFLTLWAATLIWFGADADLALAYDHSFFRMGVAALVCMLCLYYCDLYESSVLSNLREITVRVVQGWGTLCVVLALVYFAYPGLQIGRGPFALWVLLGGVLLLSWRKLFLTLSRLTGLRERVVVVGEGRLAEALVGELERRVELGLQVVGVLSEGEAEGSWASGRRLGEISDLSRVIRQEGVERVVVALEEQRGRLPVEELLRWKARGVQVQEGAELYEAVTGKVPVLSLRPSSLLFSGGFRARRSMLLAKRALSLVASVFGLLLGGPLMLIAAAVIRLSSPGPVIFRQERIGRDGKPFTLYKFRTMRADADPDQPAQADDERITPVGRWLRRTRFDELPQLFNILRGDMDIIGPRPFTPKMEEECVSRIPLYNQRWNVRPGITGWAQVHQGYCATLEDNIEKLGHDLFYIKHMSFGLDLLILFQTTKILLLGRGAR